MAADGKAVLCAISGGAQAKAPFHRYTVENAPVAALDACRRLRNFVPYVALCGSRLLLCYLIRVRDAEGTGRNLIRRNLSQEHTEISW